MKRSPTLILIGSITSLLACSTSSEPGGSGDGDVSATTDGASGASVGTSNTRDTQASGPSDEPSSTGGGTSAATATNGSTETRGQSDVATSTEASSSGGNAGVTSSGSSAGTGSEEGSGTSSDVPLVEIPDAVGCSAVNAQDATQISVDGNDIASDNRNGLTFKGFGVLSANSTSALLLDYKYRHPEEYAALLRILFGGPNPIMTHVKMEMGNDSNTSTGPESATKRSANDEANVRRAPGFQLASDAKKINPDIKVSLLRWHAPAWVGSNEDNIYAWFKDTILAAYREYGYMVDYVNPGENERTADLTWTKSYANRVHSDSDGFADSAEQELYNRIKIVISDEVGTGSFGGDMVSDTSLQSAVSVAAFHYSTDDDAAFNFTRLAEEFDVEVWNSEAQATFSNSAFRPNATPSSGIGGLNGPLEMGNTIIKGFDRSRRTHFIYQPALGSFYEGGQFSHKELVSARDPWSGWMHFDAGLQVLRHFSWFATAGWENEANDAGIWRVVAQASDTGATGTNPVDGRNGTPSYMTLASPDKADFSTVIVNDSNQTKFYRIVASNMAFEASPALEVWETRAADEGEAFNDNYLRYLCDLTADDGIYTLEVKPWSVVTVTTLPNREVREFHQPLPVEGERPVLDTDATGHDRNTTDDVLYADDFDYSDLMVGQIGAQGVVSGTQGFVESRGGSKSAIPRYFWARNGAFEVFQADGATNYVLRQQGNMGTAWNAGEPLAAVGDKSWLNYRASIDVSFESSGGDRNYAGIGARQQGGETSHSLEGTAFTLRLWQDGGWYLNRFEDSIAMGSIAAFDGSAGSWHNLALEVNGATITAFIDEEQVHSFTDDSHLSGRVDVLSGPVNVQFDNLLVERIEGQPAYYVEYLDSLQMYDLTPERKPKLVYGGSWSHAMGQAMFNYHRTLSTSSGSGATLTYTFTGTGIDILGPNDGSAKLDVTVDGQVTQTSAATMPADQLYQTFALRGLSAGEHTVELKVVAGTLVIDAVGVVE